MVRSWPKCLAALALAFVAAPAFAWQCVPAVVGGTGVATTIASDEKARAYGWWCPDAYVPAKLVFYAGPLSAFVPDWESIGLALVSGTAADRKAAHDKHTVSWPTNAEGATLVPADVWPVFSSVRTRLLAAKPADPVWRVAPNPGFTTRPAWAFANGIRASTATARATVDAPCYCDAREVLGSTVYCAVNVGRTWVSICTKRG